MFRKVFCCFVNEVLGIFFVVVDEWIVNDVLLLVLFCRVIKVFFIVFFSWGWKGVLIIYWWILLFVLVSVFMLLMLRELSMLWILVFSLFCFKNLLNVLVVVVKLFGICIFVFVRFEIILFNDVFLLFMWFILCIFSFWY